MRSSRRSLLTAGLTIAVAGCAPDPTIHGSPAVAPSPTPSDPIQGDLARRAASAVADLRAVVEQAALAAPGEAAAWLAALGPVREACDAHLDRLLSADPLQPDLPRVFEPAPATAPPTPSIEKARAALLAATERGVAELSACVAAASSQPERLLHASLAAATTAARDPQLAGRAGNASPIRFPDSPLPASVGVALSRTWALVGGLELGLGRLPGKDPLHGLGTRLLNQARELRNDLRDTVTDPLEQEVAYEMPGPMREPAEIRQGWGQLEHGVLDGLARVVASEAGDSPWLDRMLLQVSLAQSLGSPMPRWPGWAEL